MQSLLGLTILGASLLGYCFTALYKDPLFVIFYSLLAGLLGFAAVVTWLCLRKYDRKEEKPVKGDAALAYHNSDSEK